MGLQKKSFHLLRSIFILLYIFRERNKKKIQKQWKSQRNEDLALMSVIDWTAKYFKTLKHETFAYRVGGNNKK